MDRRGGRSVIALRSVPRGRTQPSRVPPAIRSAVIMLIRLQSGEVSELFDHKNNLNLRFLGDCLGSRVDRLSITSLHLTAAVQTE